ncbi:hypothetical protein [Rhodanobacter lindaniclasticus]
MSSIWKDLLFLHGHLLHKDDLEWRQDSAALETPDPKPAETPDTRDGKAAALACCAAVWPRIAAPH